MKRLLLIFPLLLGALSFPGRGEDGVSAAELAQHLGIASWTSKLRLDGSEYQLRIFYVRDGKVMNEVLAGTAHPTDREFTRVALIASQTLTGTRVSMETTGARVTRQLPEFLPLRTRVPLPQALKEGDYVLGGEIAMESLGQDKPAVAIEAVRDGLLLRVSKGAAPKVSGARPAVPGYTSVVTIELPPGVADLEERLRAHLPKGDASVTLENVPHTPLFRISVTASEPYAAATRANGLAVAIQGALRNEADSLILKIWEKAEPSLAP